MSIAARPRNAVYLEGYNGTGSTIPAYSAVKGGPDSIALPAAVSDPIFGFTAEDIPDGTRGNVQVGGVAVAIAGAAISASGLRLKPETSGKVTPWAPASGANASIPGISASSASGDGKLVEVLIGAGGIGQGA